MSRHVPPPARGRFLAGKMVLRSGRITVPGFCRACYFRRRRRRGLPNSWAPGPSLRPSRRSWTLGCGYGLLVRPGAAQGHAQLTPSESPWPSGGPVRTPSDRPGRRVHGLGMGLPSGGFPQAFAQGVNQFCSRGERKGPGFGPRAGVRATGRPPWAPWRGIENRFRRVRGPIAGFLWESLNFIETRPENRGAVDDFPTADQEEAAGGGPPGTRGPSVRGSPARMSGPGSLFGKGSARAVRKSNGPRPGNLAAWGSGLPLPDSKQ